jgi:hypothetical protein
MSRPFEARGKQERLRYGRRFFTTEFAESTEMEMLELLSSEKLHA